MGFTTMTLSSPSSPWMSTAAIRDSFLNFFRHYDHFVEPSASLIPHTDPSLLFTTAGMVPFKHYFTGLQKPPHHRLTSSQKCVRSGGKHNDLEEVGYTPRHHTFFEMLGNFSFGDYFKEEAIFYAWTFLTKTLGLSPHKLWITVYHTDTLSRSLWKKISGLEDHRILSIATLDNFWSAGDTGPCGPCSEIFYDHGDHLSGGLPGTPEEGGERFVEIWNLVFMEFDSVLQEDGTIKRIPLPKPCIDTGMGLERIAAVMQGTHDNFQTDILKALVEKSQSLTSLGAQHNEEHSKSHRVLADHIRSLCFLMADGVLPSNEGRGYVLRRILRRSLGHVHQLKGSADHLLHMADVLYETMGTTYPELLVAKETITVNLQQEYQRFAHLLDRGLSLLSQWIDPQQKTILPADKAFQLYDTYGFPLDMTLDIGRNQGFSVDEEGFQRLMEEQRQQSRDNNQKTKAFQEKTLFTELSYHLPPTVFTGYHDLESEAQVLWIGKKEGEELKEVSSLRAGEEGILIMDKTPFYGEGGGQVGDKGCFMPSKAQKASLDKTQKTVLGEISSVTKEGDFFLHHVHLQEGSVDKNNSLFLVVDKDHRQQVSVHHSATHLLQGALRRLLGHHVSQKGSLVTSHVLRFDFSHHEALSLEQLAALEKDIYDHISQNIPVSSKVVPLAQAMEEKALGLFGEKYAQDVRVITMGEASKELCGGTHVKALGDIGFVKILSESSIASGVRRIEAVAGKAALQWAQEAYAYTTHMARLLKTSSNNLPLLLEKTAAALDNSKKKDKKTPTINLGSLMKEENSFLWALLEPQGPEEKIDAKGLMGDLRFLLEKKSASFGVILTPTEKKTYSILVVTKKEGKHHGQKILTTLLGEGRGGGNEHWAQGNSTLSLEEILSLLRQI